MSRVCILLADGCEEIEAVTIIDVLRRAELDVTTVGIAGGEVEGAHGITINADTTLEQAQGGNWDLVVLPGGIPGATNLRDSPAVQSLLKSHKGKVGAICAAPIALASAGLLDGKRATCYPGFDDQLAGANYTDAEPVVVDGNIITSRGPGTALPFALRLVAELKGASTAASLGKAMLVS